VAYDINVAGEVCAYSVRSLNGEWDWANDLALLKAGGRFAPLPVAASRTVKLGGAVATVDFPVQDFMRKPGNQEEEFIHGFLDSLFDRKFSQSLLTSAAALLTEPRSNKFFAGLVALFLGCEI
jgi:hypothetical protein